MTEWRDIETAPRSGERVLITDGRTFTAAEWRYWEEPQTTSLGYGDPATGIPEGGFPKHPGHMWSCDQVPNPRAGVRTYSWFQDNPVAFSADNQEAPDWDGNFDKIAPTHWMPLPDPPA